MSAEPLTLGQRLARQIEAGGPISVAHYMGEANAHYYATRDPLGVSGDFTTAPEVSQMFGELIGLCLADTWMRSGKKSDPLYLELGPGRGTLAADALRSMASVGVNPRVHLVETSPVLQERQRALNPLATFHDTVETVPAGAAGGPILAVANEFFDALPTQQAIRTENGWRERVLVAGDGTPGERFAPIAGYRAMDGAVPEAVRGAPLGSIFETSPASATVALTLASRIMQQGGVALVIDYGHEGPVIGDTLQAVRDHARALPFSRPGDVDLTAHVDFTMIGNAARQMGLKVLGPVGQGEFLFALGIEARAASLASASPERRAEIEAALVRLTAPMQMGVLFRVMAFVHPEWAMPEGFGAN